MEDILVKHSRGFKNDNDSLGHVQCDVECAKNAEICNLHGVT